jgi:hypothetical protein
MIALLLILLLTNVLLSNPFISGYKDTISMPNFNIFFNTLQ